MRLSFFVSLFLCSTVALLMAADTNHIENTSAAPVVLTGPNSCVEDQTYERITSPADWKKTWVNHLGVNEETVLRPAMDIDFSRYEVIALFGGASSTIRGYHVDSVTRRNDCVLIRFEGIFFMTHGIPVRTTPFAFIVLPKSDTPIALETGKLPEWKEVARFAATKA